MNNPRLLLYEKHHMTTFLLVCALFSALYGRVLGIDGGPVTGLSIKNLLLGLCICTVLFSLSTRRIRFQMPAMIFVPIFLTFFMALASVVLISTFELRSPFSVASAAISLKTKIADPLIIMVVSYFAIQTAKAAVTVFKVFLIMIAFGCAITIIDIFDIPDLGLISTREDDGRVQGFFGNAAEFATVVAATLPLVIYGLSWKKRWIGFFGFLSVLVMLTCIFLAATRAPLLGLAIALVVFLLFASPHKRGLTILQAASLLLPATAITIIALQFTPYWEMIAGRFLTGTSSGDVVEFSSGRTIIWANVIQQMLQNPSSIIHGMGWDVYFQSIGHRYSTHNILLDRFYSLGILGVLMYVIAYWFALKSLLTPRDFNNSEADRFRLAAGLSLVVFIVASFFADLELAEFFVLSLVGIGLRLASIQDAETNDGINRFERTFAIPNPTRIRIR